MTSRLAKAQLARSCGSSSAQRFRQPESVAAISLLPCDPVMSARRFVLDASVAVEWFLPESMGSARYANDILAGIDQGALKPAVPDFWHYEVGSALLVAKRSKRIGAAKLRIAATLLEALQPETLVLQVTASEVIDAGLRYHLQGYDALYFELARRLDVPIASLDSGIRTACDVHKHPLLLLGAIHKA